MLQLTSYFNEQPREHSFALFLLLLISSIVIADPTTQLNLPSEFDNISVDTIFERGNEWREPEEEKNQWREPTKEKQRREVRWGARNIYDEDFDPFNPSANDEGARKSIKSPEPQRQFQIRF